MLVKRRLDCPEIDSPDGCRLRELLHPRNDPGAPGFSLAEASLQPGEGTHAHVLAQDEVYYLLEGLGLMHVAEESREVMPGDTILIPGGAVQWIENSGPGLLRFIAVVCPPWRDEDDRRV